MLAQRVFPMVFLYDTAMYISQAENKGPEDCGLYAKAILGTLSSELGEAQVGQMWQDANLDWSKLLSEPENFVKLHVRFLVVENWGKSTIIINLD